MSDFYEPVTTSGNSTGVNFRSASMEKIALYRGVSAVSDLVVVSKTAGLKLNYVKSNDGNMFYWGRRGPSVHLGYEMPAGKTITHSYSEIHVADRVVLLGKGDVVKRGEFGGD